VWIALDERDNDAVRLWTAVASSAEHACPGVGQRALELLRTPHAAVTGAIDALAGALETSGTDAVVVLDDLQLIQDGHCQQSLDYAIEVMPHRVRLVMIARSVPRPIRIARLRTQGRLVEIGAGVLAFTRAEARTVIQNVAGTTIGDTGLDAIMDRTEGWPAAVYLAALHMREDGPDAVMRVLDGSHRHVADYLAREVVHALAPETRRLLLRGSALSQLSGDLCDAVLGTDDGRRYLRDLERSNLLVTELRERRGWYVFHSLLRDHLVAELEIDEPGAASDIQRQALAWSREHGYVEDAASYAQMVGDWTALADLVEEDRFALIRTGRAATVARWTAALPPSLLAQRPGVLVGALSSGHSVGRPASAIARMLTLARREMDARPGDWQPVHRCLVYAGLSLYGEPDVAALLGAAETAMEIARSDVDDLLVLSLGILATARLLAGDDSGAALAAREALAHPDAVERPFGYQGAMATRALTDVAAGRPIAARVHADAALASARDPALVTSPSSAFGHLADAVTCALEGRMAPAERAAERAVRNAIAGGLWEAWMRAELAAIQVRRGRLAAAERSLAQVRELLSVSGDGGRVPVLMDAVEASLEAARLSATAPLPEIPSSAERAVLQRLEGRTVRQIADELYLSPNTVKTHIQSLYRKLGVTTRGDAVARASALGLFEHDDGGPLDVRDEGPHG